MRVELAAEVFTEPTPERTAISAVANLLAAFAEGRHDWIVDLDAVDDLAVYLEKHHPTLAGSYVAMAEMAAVQSAAWTGTTQMSELIVVSPAALTDHSSDLCRAAIIVVENVPGDEHFLMTVIHAFGAVRVQEAIDQGWVEFRHGGGSTVPAVAEAEAARFRRSIRVVVVFDSDSLTPEHVGPNRPKAEKLRAKQISAHVLLLREAENYAPYRVLAEIGRKAEASKKIDHLKRLLPRQRSHYDMKKGFHPQRTGRTAGLLRRSRLTDPPDSRIRLR